MGSKAVVGYDVAADHVALVTLQRLQARNAVNAEVAALLGDIAAAIERDPDIWVAVLTGEGETAFCAGADLKEVASGRIDSLYTEQGGFAGFTRLPRTKVWIAAVEGVAMAGGCELVLACDMIVASEGSVFSLPEVKRGLIAAAGGLFRLSRVLPRAIAMELIATGDAIAAERAAALGMVNALTERGGAVSGALALAARIVQNAPIAVRESLAVARSSLDMDAAALFALSEQRQGIVRKSEDFLEGPRAFVEKRPPRWTGR